MKLKVLALFVTLAATSVAQNTAHPASNVPPVTISSEAEQLARGFAAAFGEIQRTPVYLTYERAGRVWTIVSVRSVRAQGGVLVVTTDKRLTYVINARDVIDMSDSAPGE